MPTKRPGTLGMFDLKLVNDRRSAQINGKMLIARSSRMVGRMKSHAMVRSDSPLNRFAMRVDAPASRLVGEKGLSANMPGSFKRTGDRPFGRRRSSQAQLKTTFLLA